MFNARFLLALLIVAGASLAACGGNFGAGTSAPGGLIPSGPLSGLAASPTPTPSYASNIVTYGDSTAFQPLPQAAGYGGAIAFEVPSPRPSGFEAVPIGATVAIAPPTDAPDLNLLTPGKKGKKRDRPARPLAFIILLATRDVSLSTYPRIAVDVPRDVVTTYREEEINIGLYNAGDKEKIYRLAVAQHDDASPPPLPSPGMTAPPPPTPIPVSAGSPGASPSVALTPPPPSATPAPGASLAPGASPSPKVSPTLPPQRILFSSTAMPLKLWANKPVVFAVYALPMETPSPGPSGSAAAAAPSASGSPGAAGSPVAAGSPGASTAPSASASAASATAAASASGSAAPSPSGT